MLTYLGVGVVERCNRFFEEMLPHPLVQRYGWDVVFHDVIDFLNHRKVGDISSALYAPRLTL